jgi:PEP-CTERM motif-containing protein
MFAGTSYADTFAFVTPTGATTGGGPVNASANFTTSTGQVAISLSNLQANPTDVAQLISDLTFTLSGGITTGTLTTSSASFINVAGNGTTSSAGSGATGWGLDPGTLHLNVLNFSAGPSALIIGPPGAGGVYTAANGSIADNGPHNPFINQTASFTIVNAAITAQTTVTGATFSFGTTAGINVPGVPTTPVPEPSTVTLFALGLLSLGLVARFRKGAAEAK